MNKMENNKTLIERLEEIRAGEIYLGDMAQEACKELFEPVKKIQVLTDYEPAMEASLKIQKILKVLPSRRNRFVESPEVIVGVVPLERDCVVALFTKDFDKSKVYRFSTQTLYGREYDFHPEDIEREVLLYSPIFQREGKIYVPAEKITFPLYNDGHGLTRKRAWCGVRPETRESCSLVAPIPEEFKK